MTAQKVILYYILILFILLICFILVLNEIKENSITIPKIEYENSKLNKSNIILYTFLTFYLCLFTILYHFYR